MRGAQRRRGSPGKASPPPPPGPNGHLHAAVQAANRGRGGAKTVYMPRDATLRRRLGGTRKHTERNLSSMEATPSIATVTQKSRQKSLWCPCREGRGTVEPPPPHAIRRSATTGARATPQLRSPRLQRPMHRLGGTRTQPLNPRRRGPDWRSIPPPGENWQAHPQQEPPSPPSPPPRAQPPLTTGCPGHTDPPT